MTRRSASPESTPGDFDNTSTSAKYVVGVIRICEKSAVFEGMVNLRGVHHLEHTSADRKFLEKGMIDSQPRDEQVISTCLKVVGVTSDREWYYIICSMYPPGNFSEVQKGSKDISKPHMNEIRIKWAATSSNQNSNFIDRLISNVTLSKKKDLLPDLLADNTSSTSEILHNPTSRQETMVKLFVQEIESRVDLLWSLEILVLEDLVPAHGLLWSNILSAVKHINEARNKTSILVLLDTMQHRKGSSEESLVMVEKGGWAEKDVMVDGERLSEKEKTEVENASAEKEEGKLTPKLETHKVLKYRIHNPDASR